jgi:hypothetical protein
MTTWVSIARVAIVVNLLFLLSLGYVWGRNYVRLRSKHTLGMLLFVSFLFAENVLAFYLYLFDPTLRVWVTAVPPPAQQAMTGLRVAEALGLAFLTWTTWD